MGTGFLMFLVIPVLVLFVGLVIAALAIGGSYLLLRVFGRISGLNDLAEAYPATAPPEGEMHRRQWMRIGSVYYKNTADICISPQGLYLWVRPFPSKYPPAAIPWGEFRRPQRTLLYWQKAVRLTIGDPQVTTVVVTHRLFEKMRPYLHLAVS